MSWASDGTNIHPQKTLIGDFIWNISGMKRFQPVIFVIRRIVGSDINSTFFEWVLLTVILLQYQFDISPVSSFTQKLTALSSFYKCWCNSLVVGELWDFDVLRKWGGSEIFLSPGSFNFWFWIWFCGDEVGGRFPSGFSRMRGMVKSLKTCQGMSTTVCKWRRLSTDITYDLVVRCSHFKWKNPSFH